MKQSITNSIEKYIKKIKTDTWIADEAYKFEFANYVNQNIDWKEQNDEEVLKTLKKSQKIKYVGNEQGIQFLIKSGREKLSEFIRIEDVQLFRRVLTENIENIDWNKRTMSFTGLSTWLASLFPEKLYPIPLTGFSNTINYLFGTVNDKFPKRGLEYILHCQKYMTETEQVLTNYSIEELNLKEWNKFYKANPELKINSKEKLSKIDWVWLVQDFHLFVHREILGLYKKKEKKITILEDFEPVVIEGASVLAAHMKYERNQSFIRKIKENALRENKMLNCEICGFSFLEFYGEIGEGFIEAHHIKPLFESNQQRKTTKEDIVLVCPNCHRMLHKGYPNITIEDFKKICEEK